MTDEVQKPCSEILVNLCRGVKTSSSAGGKASHLERVMDVLMTKLDGGSSGDGKADSSSPASTPVAGRKTSSASSGSGANPHYYVIQTVSAISVVNPIEVLIFTPHVTKLMSILVGTFHIE